MASVIERTLKGGGGFFVANVLNRGLGFAFIVVASRVLGPAEFGILALGLSIVRVAQKIAVFGLPNTIQRFLSGKGEERSERLYGAILLIGTGGAILASSVLYLITPFLTSAFAEPSLAAPLRVLSLSILVGAAFAILRAVLQAQEQVQQIVTVDTLKGVGKVGLLLPLFLYTQSATSASWAVVGSFGISITVGVVYVKKIDHDVAFSVEWKDVKTVLGYSAPLVVVGLGYFLAQQADRLMLGWLGDASSVGVYTVTSTLAMAMSMLHGALVSIFMPIASEAYRNGQTREMRRAYQFISKWSGAVSGVGLLVFVGLGEVLLKVFGGSYANQTTYDVLIILSVLYFVGTWVGPTGALLQMSDGNRAEMLNTIVFILLNVLLNYVLIRIYGVVGAALATTISGVVRNVIQLYENYIWNSVTPINYNTTVVLCVVLMGTGLSFVASELFVKVFASSVSIGILMWFLLRNITKEEALIMANITDRVGKYVA